MDRSSLSIRGLSIGGGVIDQDYKGHVSIIIHNLRDVTQIIEKWEKYAQLILERCTLPKDVIWANGMVSIFSHKCWGYKYIIVIMIYRGSSYLPTLRGSEGSLGWDRLADSCKRRTYKIFIYICIYMTCVKLSFFLSNPEQWVHVTAPGSSNK